MKIVIDISDQKYKWIVDNPQAYTDDLCEAIRNGTPLPEHHGRLISEKDVLSVILFSKLFDSAKVGEVKEVLSNITTIIEGSDSE